MNWIIIGNIVSLIGCILMVGIGFIQRKERILAVQCVQFAFMGTANLLLGGFAGFISNMVSILRNLVFAKRNSSNLLKLVFVVIQFILSAGALTNGWIEWLPILSAVLFTLVIDTPRELTLKSVIIVCQIMWLVYDIFYVNYTAALFDGMTIISTLIGIVMLKKPGQN